MITRGFNGIGAGSPAAIGAATICDMYFLHERGFYMGVFTFFLTNGPHAASLFGGFIAQYLGWEWCFLIPVSSPPRLLYVGRTNAIKGLCSVGNCGVHTLLL